MHGRGCTPLHARASAGKDTCNSHNACDGNVKNLLLTGVNVMTEFDVPLMAMYCVYLPNVWFCTNNLSHASLLWVWRFVVASMFGNYIGMPDQITVPTSRGRHCQPETTALGYTIHWVGGNASCTTILYHMGI